MNRNLFASATTTEELDAQFEEILTEHPDATAEQLDRVNVAYQARREALVSGASHLLGAVA